MAALIDVKKYVTNTGINVYSFYGELDEMNVDTVFTNVIADIGNYTDIKLIFNLGNLHYLNSKAIGWLADIAQNTRDGGWKMVLCDVSAEVRDTLELDGIATIIPICINERAAYGEFLNESWFSE